MSEVVVNTAEGTNGITFSGKTFTVPVTQDMLETLFNPSIRKSYLEIFVLLSLAANSLVFLFVDSNQLRIKTFIGLYIFWRLSYNFGIGYLLHNQSKYNKLVGWFESWNLFSGKSAVSKLARAEVKAQRGADYSIEAYPIEFNTWLIFRKVVDLILMSDFTTFFCLVVACAIDDDYQFLKYQPTWLTASRLSIGAALIVFNFWVKVNAHNTIKDYAWYWGDFFFRQINNEELIFDGVFEMVPHPMYSVGYVGYYGFALIAKSYTVLTVAIFGHFLQMIFLHFIENPHIDKIYGPSKNEINWQTLLKLKDLKNFNNVKPLVGLYNFNILRSSDIFNLLISITYGIIIPVFAANSNLTSFSVNSWKLDYFFVLAVAIKLFESVFINTSLILQSHYKIFTKWYLSVDAPVENSLENWSVLYNTLINFSYSSLFGLQVYKYILADESTITLFQDWTSLRIFVGCLLIVTQVWINSSIIDSLGYFGWFYGDFFVPKSQRSMAHLTKAGVYRYLNNPEQIFGVCGVMGVFVISPIVENLICSSIWVANNFFRINFIEKVHMIKIYGEQEVSKDSGVTKTFKKHLIPDIIQRRLSESENAHRVGVKTRRQSSIAESVDRFIRDLRNSSTKLSRQHLIELSNNLTFENSDYKLIVNGLRENKVVAGTKEGAFIPKIASIGSPITVSWSSPKESHTTSDWIGLYKIVQTSYSRTKTLISSSGRWNWCTSVEGTMTFEGEKLFWEEGLYEFRYHSGAGHDVSYISEPFEIQTDKVIVPVDEDELVEFAEILKTNIFDKVLPLGTIDDSISSAAENSENIMETFNLLSELISKATDIKISSKIFLNNKDGAEPFTIKKLAKKLIGFRRVLEELSR